MPDESDDDTVVDDETVTEAARRRQSERADHVQSMIGDEAAGMLEERTYPTTSEELAQEYAIDALDLPNETESLSHVFDRLENEAYTTPAEAKAAVARAVGGPLPEAETETAGDVAEPEEPETDTIPSETAETIAEEDLEPPADEEVEPTLEHEMAGSTDEAGGTQPPPEREEPEPMVDAEAVEPPADTEMGEPPHREETTEPPLEEEREPDYRADAVQPTVEDAETEVPDEIEAVELHDDEASEASEHEAGDENEP